MATERRPSGGLLGALVRFCLERKLVVALLTLFVLGWGVVVAPFHWEFELLPRNPVAVDAIPDLGENQQVVFSEWPGRSPQDVEDQITYPLTVALLGVPSVRTVRSFSMFGFSSIYVIFDEDADFYWSRSRVLEKLASLSGGTLPEGVQPTLGPDATALGQVFWYTLEGRTPDGRPAGGWDTQELRSVQDWYVRYGLLAAEGVAEVASVGGFVAEYQIDVDPDAMRAAGVSLEDVFRAVRASNLDVGARTVEVNHVEYVIRGLGFLESLEDIENTVVRVTDDVPIYVSDVAHVGRGPALRRGVLDKDGSEAVGGVALARFGYNPLAALDNLHEKVDELAAGLPSRAVVDWQRADVAAVERFARESGFEPWGAGIPGDLDQATWTDWLRQAPEADVPDWLELSTVTIVPFYDRTGLIRETLGTLEDALVAQVLVTVIVVLLMLAHLPSTLLISALLPLSVLMCFIFMKLFGVDANIVALSGIAIAIGTMVDMGIILCGNIFEHLEQAEPDEPRLEVVYRATMEVAGAVLTSIATTVVSFLPVFTMSGAEGKLFRPLAFTKTFALVASLLVALTILPAVAHMVFRRRGDAGVWRRRLRRTASLLLALLVLVLLNQRWMPLGLERSEVTNLLFAGALVLSLWGAFALFQRWYADILRWCLAHKAAFLSLPLALLLAGASSWLGFERVFGVVPRAIEAVGVDADWLRGSRPWVAANHAMPGLGREFMPPLDEGSYLYMPTTMPHASIGEAYDALRAQDVAIRAIPEVESVVGKIGRAESPLDPAPISMVETIINYRSEYLEDADGRRLRFRFDDESGQFERNAHGELIGDEDGRPFRQWREHIRGPDDIWDEIVAAAQVPGSTSAPRLQPIAARQVMLQSGMRAPMGIKVMGPDLESIEQAGLAFERLLPRAAGVEPAAVLADRVVGKPYLEIDLDRRALARYGLSIRDVQEVIEVAIGGKRLTTTVEGRERYPVRVRYSRELRDNLEDLGRILVTSRSGAQVPLSEVSELRFVRGPQAIKSEDTRLVSYVIFDARAGFAEVDVVESARDVIQSALASGELVLPQGVSWSFAGSYENQVRAQRTLAILLPLSLFVIFLLLYLQFSRVSTTLFVWSGVAVAWSGGFLLLWLFGREGFLDFEVAGRSLRDVFHVGPVNLSVAVWVGFLALFGIATDDGVVIATYLDQSFERNEPDTVAGLRAATLEAGQRRVRPCLMTTATTILALLPVLTSSGRGSDLMLPMALPSVGGMAIEVLTMLIVPVLYCGWRELRLKRR
ncbi:MAG TPA: efflux RND transporter permease subunit [Planctomycetota bacterium]|nr:efflux RND transporter permease subunit [Planctomycetota bacterium]